MTLKKTVILLNADPDLANLLSLILSTHGYDFKTASYDVDIITSVSQGVDLVLLDIHNNSNDLLKTCLLIKKHPLCKHIPVIVLSQNVRKGERTEALALGADDYIRKPFEAEELITRVDAVIKRDLMQGHHHEQSLEMIAELDQIIKQELVIPFFQPIYLLKPLQLYGFEVLSRPQGSGLLNDPESLFKASLKYGRYYELEMIVWRKAMEIAQRQVQGERLFLNCNPFYIECSKQDELKDMVRSHGLKEQNIFLELTERFAVGEFKSFMERLGHYRDCGFKFVIDDAGAGYSSLESIVQTRPEVVKIDRHMVTGISKDGFKRSLVKLISGFCKENDILCIAEGIEDKSDFEALVDLNVSAGQGYYLYKPSSASHIDAMRIIA